MIDLREDHERFDKNVECDNLMHVPMSQISDKRKEFNRNESYILFCVKGIRSSRLAQALKSDGYEKVYSVVGGADVVQSYLEGSIFSKG